MGLQEQANIKGKEVIAILQLVSLCMTVVNNLAASVSLVQFSAYRSWKVLFMVGLPEYYSKTL